MKMIIAQCLIFVSSLIHIASFAPSNLNNLSFLQRKNVLSMAFEWQETKKHAEDKMTKSIDSVLAAFGTLRGGGASPAMLDRISVEFFGSMKPISQLSRIKVENSEMLVVEPFDPKIIKDIEKAIISSTLNLTPSNDGSGVLKIRVPPPTEERRKELVRQAKGLCEDGKVALRNIRRDFIEKIRKAERDKIINKEMCKDHQEQLQKVTDNYVKKMDSLLKTKEQNLMAV